MAQLHVDPDVAVSRGISKQTGEWRVAPMFRLLEGEEIVFDLSVETAEELAAKLESEVAIIRSSQPN
jgi:hypothetical protein